MCLSAVFCYKTTTEWDTNRFITRVLSREGGGGGGAGGKLLPQTAQLPPPKGSEFHIITD